MSLPISGFQRPLAEWRQESINKVEPRPGVFEFYDTGFSAKPCLRGATHFRWEYVEKWESSLNNHFVVHKATSGGQMPECNK
jgi:hypothetical protein